jgi:hypothetical protein
MWSPTLELLYITSSTLLLATVSPISNAQLVDSSLDLNTWPFHWARDTINISAPKPLISKNGYIGEFYHHTNDAPRAVLW